MDNWDQFTGNQWDSFFAYDWDSFLGAPLVLFSIAAKQIYCPATFGDMFAAGVVASQTFRPGAVAKGQEIE
jgi:hypothetical protein